MPRCRTCFSFTTHAAKVIHFHTRFHGFRFCVKGLIVLHLFFLLLGTLFDYEIGSGLYPGRHSLESSVISHVWYFRMECVRPLGSFRVEFFSHQRVHCSVER